MSGDSAAGPAEHLDDAQLVERISALADEERRLEEAHVGQPLTPEERSRLDQVEVALDQCWDLLRQRRARRNNDRDPEAATVRPPEVVETYEQ